MLRQIERVINIHRSPIDYFAMRDFYFRRVVYIKII